MSRSRASWRITAAERSQAREMQGAISAWMILRQALVTRIHIPILRLPPLTAYVIARRLQVHVLPTVQPHRDAQIHDCV